MEVVAMERVPEGRGALARAVAMSPRIATTTRRDEQERKRCSIACSFA
jgi:carboxylesterase type B